MARPVWTGTISFGLVAIPIKLYNAVRKQSVSFNQLDDRTMARIRYKKVSDLDGEVVPDDHIVKGYEISKGQYVIVNPDELEPFMPVATKSIDLTEFVEIEEIDPVLFDAAYHVAPSTNPKPYALLAKAMEDAGKVGIGRFVMRNKQYTAALRAEEGRLVMSTLVYADELVDPNSIEDLAELTDISLDPKEVAMAESLVDSMTAAFDPTIFHDEYRTQVLGLIDQKAAGQDFVAPERSEDVPNVIDLMAALEASVNAAKQARRAKAETPSEAPADTPSKAPTDEQPEVGDERRAARPKKSSTASKAVRKKRSA